MSLGWQSESALLPSKSKPINVDGKSMVGLKALLYNEERERQSGSNRTGTRKVRDNDRSSYCRSKDKGGRQAIQTEDEATSKETAAMRALSAKSELYEQLLQGNTDLSSDLIDFSEKRVLSKDSEREKPLTNNNVVPPPAPPSVPKPAHIVLNSFLTSTNTVESSSSINTSNHHQSSGNTASQWSWSKGSEKSSSERRPEESNIRGSSYANTGTDSNRLYFEEIAQERALKKAIDEKVRLEAERSHSSSMDASTGGSGGLSEGARIKTQWEKTLNSSARGYLDEIHEAAMKQRVSTDGAAAGDNGNSSQIVGTGSSGSGSGQLKRSLKDERLELIRQKRSKAAALS